MRDGFRHVADLVRTALKYARRSRDFSLQPNEKLLDELDKTAARHWMWVPRENVAGTKTIDKRKNGLHWASELKVENPNDLKLTIPHDDFLSLTIEYGLLEYVEAKLDHNSLLLKQKAGRPLLDYLVSKVVECPPPPELASLLLQYGADRNHEFNGETTWQRTISHIWGLSLTDREKNMPWKGIFKILLDAGADPNTLARRVEKPAPGKTYHESAPSARLQLVTPLSVVSEMTRGSRRYGSQVPFSDKELELRLKLSGARYINNWMHVKNESILDDKDELQATVNDYLSGKKNKRKPAVDTERTEVRSISFSSSSEGDLTDDDQSALEVPASRVTVLKERNRDNSLHSKNSNFISVPHGSQGNTTTNVAGSEGAATKSKRKSFLAWMKSRG